MKSVVLTVVGGALSGCLGGDDGLPAGVNGTVYDAGMAETLRILESSLYRDQRSFGVHGTVKNVGDRPVIDVEAHARLLDPDRDVIGEFYDDNPRTDEVWRLEPGEAADFDVEFPDTEPSEVDEAVKYEVWATGDPPV